MEMWWKARDGKWWSSLVRNLLALPVGFGFGWLVHPYFVDASDVVPIALLTVAIGAPAILWSAPNAREGNAEGLQPATERWRWGVLVVGSCGALAGKLAGEIVIYTLAASDDPTCLGRQ